MVISKREDHPSHWYIVAQEDGYLPTREEDGYLPTREEDGYLPTREEDGYLPTREEGGYLPTREEEIATAFHPQGRRKSELPSRKACRKSWFQN